MTVLEIECDKANNGYAVIRFLPAPDGEDLPFVKLYSHAFQGNGGWLLTRVGLLWEQSAPYVNIIRSIVELWYRFQ
jgi:hypothetical protein